MEAAIAIVVVAIIAAIMSDRAHKREKKAQKERENQIADARAARKKRKQEGIEMDAVEAEKIRDAHRRRIAANKDSDQRTAVSILSDQGPVRSDLQSIDGVNRDE